MRDYNTHPPAPRCEKTGWCRHHEACSILGECVFEHSLIRDNPEAVDTISQATTVKHIAKAFHKIKPFVKLKMKK